MNKAVPAPTGTTASRAQGKVFAVRGNVVDVRFAGRLPQRNQQLRAGPEGSVVLEVETHLDTSTVRCIALNATRALA